MTPLNLLWLRQLFLHITHIMKMTAIKLRNEPLMGVCPNCRYERPCNHKDWGREYGLRYE